MANETCVQGIEVDIATINVGQTAAIFFGSTASLVSTWIYYVSGGTLKIGNALNGSTMAGGTLAAGSFANLSVTYPYQIAGPAAFYLAAGGATCVAHVIRHFNSVV